MVVNIILDCFTDQAPGYRASKKQETKQNRLVCHYNGYNKNIAL